MNCDARNHELKILKICLKITFQTSSSHNVSFSKRIFDASSIFLVFPISVTCQTHRNRTYMYMSLFQQYQLSTTVPLSLTSSYFEPEFPQIFCFHQFHTHTTIRNWSLILKQATYAYIHTSCKGYIHVHIFILAPLVNSI